MNYVRFQLPGLSQPAFSQRTSQLFFDQTAAYGSGLTGLPSFSIDGLTPALQKMNFEKVTQEFGAANSSRWPTKDLFFTAYHMEEPMEVDVSYSPPLKSHSCSLSASLPIMIHCRKRSASDALQNGMLQHN